MSDLAEQIKPAGGSVDTKMLDILREYAGALIKTPWADLAAEIEAQTVELRTSNAGRMKNPKHAWYLNLSCSILAAYRTLAAHFEKQQDLIDLMQKGTTDLFYAEGIDNYLERRFSIKPNLPDLAWECVCTQFKAKGEEQFGSAWHYEQSIKDDYRCFVNVTKCGFADFFIENDARELVYIFCALDYVWGDALEKYGIRFERPTILPEGSDACRFQFFKIAGK